MRKHGLKVLGMSLLAALGLMALSAAAAQAGSEIQVNGAALKTTKGVKGAVGAGELLTAGGVKIGCTAGTFGGEVFNSGAVGKIKVKLLYTGCKVLGADTFCKFYEELPMVGQGSIATTGVGTFFVHTDGKHYLLLEGLGESKTLADFLILDPELLERCVLPEGHYIVKGSNVYALPDALTTQVAHSITTIAPATLAALFPKDQLFLGAEKSHLEAGTTATVELESKELWNVK